MEQKELTYTAFCKEMRQNLYTIKKHIKKTIKNYTHGQFGQSKSNDN